MKRLGTMLVLIAALGLVGASSAFADVRGPANSTWTGIAPANTSWTGLAPADVRRPSDVRQGRRPANASWTGIAPRSWSDGARRAT